jgi:tetratricopeptide (TPR) repeat protein
VSLLRRKTPFVRTDILEQAARAARKRGRRQRRKAITLYREGLAREPENLDLHRKLAPLLAADGQLDEAWGSYRRAVDALSKRGFVGQAIGVCREAVAALPREVAAWRALAQLELVRGRRADAVKSLLEGRRHCRGRARAREAMELLGEILRVDPSQIDVSLDLASLLARSGDRARALALLDETLAVRPDRARRLRAAQFWIAPGCKTAWRWLRALFGAA